MAFDEQDFQKTLTYLSDAAPATVLAALEAIRHFHQGQEEHLAREPGGCGWYLLVCFVCFLVSGSTLAITTKEPKWGWGSEFPTRKFSLI